MLYQWREDMIRMWQFSKNNVQRHYGKVPSQDAG